MYFFKDFKNRTPKYRDLLNKNYNYFLYLTEYKSWKNIRLNSLFIGVYDKSIGLTWWIIKDKGKLFSDVYSALVVNKNILEFLFWKKIVLQLSNKETIIFHYSGVYMPFIRTLSLIWYK